MPRAQLKSSNLSHSAIDDSTGVISGCKLMQLGKTAHFKRSDGTPDSFEVTAELIKGLLNHAGNRSIPCHFTHDSEDLHARLGLHKNLRVDDDGDLASDLHTMPNEYGKLALWTAKTDPKSAAFSAVFSYNPIKDGNRKLAVPLSFDAADLVAIGAACDAMLSHFTQDTDMTKDEIVALIKENAASKQDVTDAVKAALSGVITPEESDKRIKAALAEFKPDTAKLSEAEMDDLLMKAEAKFTAKLGGGPLLKNLQRANEENDTYTATLKKYMETSGGSRPKAVLRMLQDHPELQDTHAAAQAAEIAKLNAA